MEHLVDELQLARVVAKLYQIEAAAYSEQLLHLQMRLEESENHHSTTEKKEAKGNERQKSLAAEVGSLKEELANYKAREEECWANKRKIVLEVTRIC